MNYGLVFVLDMYDFERGEEMHVLTLPGDYIRMSGWASKHLPDDEGETVGNLRRNYALAYFALRRRGELEGLGLPGELDLDATDAMADRFSVYVSDVGESDLPLTQGRGGSPS